MSRRPPTRRPASRKRRPAPRRRRKQDPVPLLAAGVVAVVAVLALVRWLVANWWLLVVVAVVAACVGGAWLYRQMERAKWEQARINGLRYGLAAIDAMHFDAFEYAIRDLMRRDGCKAEKLGGSGDNGCDVRATDPAGRRWVIQCKHRRNGLAGSAIGTPDLQVLNGTARQVHGADVVVLVTNGRFSAPAIPFGKSQRIHLVDRKVLDQWAAGSRPLWEVLRIPASRKPTAPS